MRRLLHAVVGTVADVIFECSDRHEAVVIYQAQYPDYVLMDIEAGTPWLAESSLDVIAIFDQPAWAALVALIAECPVMHGALTASLEHHTQVIDAHAFTFIAGNTDIAIVRDFIGSLPDLLGYTITRANARARSDSEPGPRAG